MEAMQTLNPADVWDMVQKAIVWLAGIGIVIEFDSLTDLQSSQTRD